MKKYLKSWDAHSDALNPRLHEARKALKKELERVEW